MPDTVGSEPHEPTSLRAIANKARADKQHRSLYKALFNARNEAIARTHDTNALNITLPCVVAEAEESERLFANGDV